MGQAEITSHSSRAKRQVHTSLIIPAQSQSVPIPAALHVASENTSQASQSSIEAAKTEGQQNMLSIAERVKLLVEAATGGTASQSSSSVSGAQLRSTT